MILKINYTPLKAGAEFHASPSSRKLAKGGKGSGKTEALLHEAFMLSQEFPNNRGLLARETFGEVEEILIDPMLDIVPEALILDYSQQKHKLIFTNGSIIYFRALDEARKFKGLNLGFFGIDEVDAIKQEVWLQLEGQLRRPGVRRVGMGTTNPTPYEHWVYEMFVKNQFPNYEVFTFRTKDNPYLPKDFYDNLFRTMPESWVKRYLEGEWGSISLGDRVYTGFSEKLHREDRLVYNPSLPVIRGWDFGLSGQCVIFAQRRGDLGLDFLDEIFRKNMTSRDFARLVGQYEQEHFPNAMYEDYGDVAGGHRDPTSGRSPIEEIGSELHTRILSDTMDLRDSLDLVRNKLAQNFDGAAALRFSSRMRLSIEGLNGGYVFKKDKAGNVVSDVPASDPIFEHVMDAVRYLIWNVFAYQRVDSFNNELPMMEMVDTEGLIAW